MVKQVLKGGKNKKRARFMGRHHNRFLGRSPGSSLCRCIYNTTEWGKEARDSEENNKNNGDRSRYHGVMGLNEPGGREGLKGQLGRSNKPQRWGKKGENKGEKGRGWEKKRKACQKESPIYTDN